MPVDFESSDDELYQVARLGIEVEAWFRTPVGAYVLKRAEAEVEDAFNQWLDTPDPRDQITPNLHQRANAARAAILWLNDAIHDGQAAEASLEEEQIHE